MFETDDFGVRRMAVEHAGGKWQLRYLGAQGQGGNLEVDLNFLHRIPLEPIRVMDSKLFGSFQAKNIPVLDLHDLAAGKLIALLDRSAARDVFDAAGLFAHPEMEMERLRLPNSHSLWPHPSARIHWTQRVVLFRHPGGRRGCSTSLSVLGESLLIALNIARLPTIAQGEPHLHGAFSALAFA